MACGAAIGAGVARDSRSNCHCLTGAYGTGITSSASTVDEITPLTMGAAMRRLT